MDELLESFQIGSNIRSQRLSDDLRRREMAGRDAQMEMSRRASERQEQIDHQKLAQFTAETAAKAAEDAELGVASSLLAASISEVPDRDKGRVASAIYAPLAAKYPKYATAFGSIVDDLEAMNPDSPKNRLLEAQIKKQQEMDRPTPSEAGRRAAEYKDLSGHAMSPEQLDVNFGVAPRELADRKQARFQYVESMMDKASRDLTLRPKNDQGKPMSLEEMEEYFGKRFDAGNKTPAPSASKEVSPKEESPAKAGRITWDNATGKLMLNGKPVTAPRSAAEARARQTAPKPPPLYGFDHRFGGAFQ